MRDTLAGLLGISHPRRLVLLALLAALGLFVLYIQMSNPATYLARDSFTYFTMVQEFYDHGLLYSYSGVDHATGIHPGYYFLLLLLYPLLGMELPVWSFVLNGGLLLAGLLLCYRAFGTTVAVVMSLLVLVSYGASATNNGMESSLLFFALGATALFVSRLSAPLPTARQALLLGLVLGAVVFVRLDSIFFVGVLCLVLLVRALFINRVSSGGLLALARAAALVAAPFTVFVAVIFALNLHYDGSLLPLSGSLKSSFPVLGPHWQSNLFLPLKMFIAAILVLGAYLGWVLWRKETPEVMPVALWVGCVALYLYNGLFVSDIGAWYWALPFFALAVGAGLWVRDLFAVALLPRFAAAAWCVVLAAAAGGVICSHLLRPGDDWISPHIAAALYLDAQAMPGDAAGELKDGVFAFYARLPVYNLTGLGNNREYADALRQGTLRQYMEKRHIVYVAAGSVYSGVQVPGALGGFDCSRPFYNNGKVMLFAIGNCTLL